MTDELDRIFVTIAYDGEFHGVKAKVKSELEERLAGFPFKYQITENKPPSVFTAQELEDKYVYLYNAAQKYKTLYSGMFNVELQIDPRLLYVATMSAYDDIERYKTYHLEKPYRDRSDAIKRSAYLTKWLSKMAPFQTRPDLDIARHKSGISDNNLSAIPALANISFAIKVSMVYVALDCGKNNVSLSEEAEFRLSYDLLYRRVNEDALLATYQKVMDLARGIDVVVTN